MTAEGLYKINLELFCTMSIGVTASIVEAPEKVDPLRLQAGCERLSLAVLGSPE